MSQSWVKANPSSQGVQIGQVLIKSVGNLDLMKNGCLGDKQDIDITKTFKVVCILFECLKAIDSTAEEAKRKFRIEEFLRKA